jgi:tRNA dimethylallyltransferase
MDSNTIIFIVGPTAVGKTEVAVLLAERMRGEIISCDSMQVYREINIASNKPPKELLERVPHHMIGTISIAEEFDVAAFNRDALSKIDDIRRCNRVPVICGGSGLYMSVLLDGIFEEAACDAAVREALAQEADEKGEAFLYSKLKEADPPAAARIHPHDRRRIIRALEVFNVSKAPISQLQKKRRGLWGQHDIKIIALDRERAELYARIDERVESMFKEGLSDEIRALAKRRWSRTAEKIIGVRELKGYFSGEYDLERAKSLIKLNTRRYAKRQLTWFRRDKRLCWIMIPDGEGPLKTATRILTSLKK